MEIAVGEQGRELTWQDEFPPTVKCVHCGGEARQAITICESPDDKDYICKLHPNEPYTGFWPHDLCAISVYLCRQCLEPTALFNQA